MLHKLDQTAIDDLLRVTGPNTVAKAGWRFNYDVILEFVKLQGLKYPIRLRYSSGRYRKGTCYFDSQENCHRIIISQTKPVEDANKTLWHELAHAIQCEAVDPPADFWRKYYKPWGMSGNVYGNNPYEIQANEFAAKNQHVKLLA